LRLELQEDPVTERRLGDGLEVVEGDVIAALEQGAHLAAEHQRLQPAWTGAPAHIATDAVELGPVGMRGRDQAGGIAQHVLSGRVCVPTVTVRSCIASSSALCVLGVARLISSARTRFAKIGPA